MTATRPAPYTIKWENLPDNYVLDDAPVDNINQPPIAAALTESLELAGKLPANSITITNYGICATVNERIVIKAPDWGFVSSVRVAKTEIKRSYTPQLQGTEAAEQERQRADRLAAQLRAAGLKPEA